MKHEFEKIPCPVCGEVEASTVRTSADIVKCHGCDLVYLRTRFTRQTMFEVYQSYAREESHMRLPKTVDEIRTTGIRREGFLQELPTEIKPGRMLDIGCGWAAMLLNARGKGFQVEGVELTGIAVEFANTILGIPVFQGQIEDATIKPGLRLVTMLHTLEHLPTPSEALTKIHSLLEPGGWFCGIVPNFDSICSRTLGEKWGWLDPNYHYTHYTPSTLAKTLQRFGFRMRKLFTTNGDYHRPDVEAVAASKGLTLDECNTMMMGEEIHFFFQKE